MRIIPKKIKTKSNVWKCYSMKDIMIALIMFAMIFVMITLSKWGLAAIFGIMSVIMFMPTSDGIFYTYIFENLKFLFGKKVFIKGAKSEKRDVASLIEIKEIRDNGLIVYKDRYIGRVIRLGQKNFKIEDEEQQDIDIDYFAGALKQLEETQMADIVKIDRPITLDKFASDLYLRLKSVKDSFASEETKKMRERILTERIDKVDQLNNIVKEYVSEYYMVIYGKGESDLDNTALNIATEISRCGISAKILDRDKTAVFLKYCFTREFDEREVCTIKTEDLVNWILPDKVEFKSNKFVADNIESSVMALSDYPLRVKNAWGANLFNIADTKVVMRISPVDKFKAIKRIDKCIGEMEVKQILSQNASETNTATIHRNSMSALLDRLQAENESLFDVTLTVTAYNYKKSDNFKKAVRRSITSGNFKTTTLYGLQTEGFKSSALTPTLTLKNYANGINSSSVAAAFPFVRNYVLDDGGIMLGENKDVGFPFILNIWKRGNLYQNSNAMIIGQSGAGKSFFLKTFIVNEWANGTRIICLDPEAEYISLADNLNGNVIDIGSAKTGKINPFHVYKILTEDGVAADSAVTFNTHLKMLESFFRVVLVGAPSDIIEMINNLTVMTYARKGITEKTDFSILKPEEYPLFSDLYETLIAERKRNDKTQFDDKDFRTASLYLQKFIKGRYSDIWNSPSTLSVDANMIDFNFQSLFANKNNVIANAQMLLVFRFIEQEIINARESNRHGKNLKTMIIVDEAHLFLDAKFPIALDFFHSMSKRIRKYNGSFIPATQNIADWNGNEELRNKTSAILKNSQYMFIFKLSAPDMRDVIEIYKAGNGFNKDEQRMIMSAVTGQAFFIGSTELRTSVNISAGEYMQELFDKKEVKLGENKIE